MTWAEALIDPRAVQALIAGTFVALGWLVNGFANRRRDAKQRAERVRDVQRALFAEIRAYLAALKAVDLRVYGAGIERRIMSEPGYFPVIPTERNDHVFQAIIGDIHVLPRQVIDPVVLYYSQLSAISALIDDLRALDVAKVGPDRASAMYRDYIALKIEAIDLGEEALLMMGGWLVGGRERVIEIQERRRKEDESRLTQSAPQLRAELSAMREKVSNPASGRSDL